MRLVSCAQGKRDGVAARLNDRLIDLASADPELPGSMKAMLRAGPATLARAARAAQQAGAGAELDASSIRYLPVVPDAGKIFCLGLNYAAHAAEGGNAVPAYPALFLRTAGSLIGHGQSIIRSRLSDTLDFEAELAVVIGKPVRRVPVSKALDAVAGYSCFNDGSVREYQRKTTQWTIGKNFEATGGFGPELVTADELPAGARGLRIRSILNGQTMQDDNTSNMIVSVADAISLISDCVTLEPGDVIVMGTPSGVGYARTPPVFMRPGDLCEIQIEGVGTLSNRITDETA
ncbi:MAG: fumarylacetoacetate hydrolase family protein [Quisquiliibacterium sp.]